MALVDSCATNPFPWLEVLRAVAPLLAAVIAGLVAIIFGRIQTSISKQQAKTAEDAARTAKNKLKLDLFEKRFVVYDSAQKYMLTALTRDTTPEDEIEYLQATQGARWLFDEHISNLLEKELWTLCTHLRALQKTLEYQRSSDDAHLSDQILTTRKKLNQLRERFDTVFEPFLHIAT